MILMIDEAQGIKMTTTYSYFKYFDIFCSKDICNFLKLLNINKFNKFQKKTKENTIGKDVVRDKGVVRDMSVVRDKKIITFISRAIWNITEKNG